VSYLPGHKSDDGVKYYGTIAQPQDTAELVSSITR